jgi:5-formyltetrahydrofolate cyclo-ligase
LNKSEWRTFLQTKRRALSLERQREASSLVVRHLIPELAPFKAILSFASFGSEIETASLNLFLANSNRLLLPRIKGEELEIFFVTDPNQELIPNQWGIFEPNPSLCKKATLAEIELVLVPAVGFDEEGHRLGYGRGFYDRLLSQIPHAYTIGIGFKEQLSPQLPVEKHDIPLAKVSLF